MIDDYTKVDLSLAPVGQIVNVPVKQLLAHPYNREIYDDILPEDPSTVAMVDSVLEVGIRDPLKIMSNSRVLSGHRRLKVAELAGLYSVPCIVDHDVQSEAMAKVILLTHNVHQREKTRVEKIREQLAYADLVSGVNVLDGIESGRSGAVAQLVSSPGVDDARLLPEEERQRLRDEINQARKALGLENFDKYAIAAYRFGTARKGLKEQKRIVGALSVLRSAGRHKEAEELLRCLNRSVASAIKYLMDNKIYNPGAVPQTRAPRDAKVTCEKMIATLLEMLTRFKPILDQDGHLVLGRIENEARRLVHYLMPENLMCRSDAKKLEELAEEHQ